MSVIYLSRYIVFKSLSYSHEFSCKSLIGNDLVWKNLIGKRLSYNRLTTASNVGSKSHLSDGASAGIGVGSAVGVLELAALLFFFSRRYKVVKIEGSDRNSEPGSAHPAMTSSSGVTPSIVYKAGVAQPHEVGGVAVNPVYEAGMGNEIHEIAIPRTSFGQ